MSWDTPTPGLPFLLLVDQPGSTYLLICRARRAGLHSLPRQVLWEATGVFGTNWAAVGSAAGLMHLTWF